MTGQLAGLTANIPADLLRGNGKQPAGFRDEAPRLSFRPRPRREALRPPRVRRGTKRTRGSWRNQAVAQAASPQPPLRLPGEPLALSNCTLCPAANLG